MTTEFETTVREKTEKIFVKEVPTKQRESHLGAAEDGLFDVSDDGAICVSECGDQEVISIINRNGRHFDPRIVPRLLRFLGENSGKKVAHIFGYTPRNIDGSEPFDGNKVTNQNGEDLEIGKMLLPDVEGFSLTITASRSEKRDANIRLKFYGLNGAANIISERSISQETPLSNISTMLTVHVVTKCVRFQNQNGDYFYWRKVLSVGDVINTHKIRNEYLIDGDGYQRVYDLPGTPNPIRTIDYDSPRHYHSAINKNKTFTIGCDIDVKAYFDASIGLSGELKLLESIDLDYEIPAGGDYIFNENNRFEHIWTIRQ